MSTHALRIAAIAAVSAATLAGCSYNQRERPTAHETTRGPAVHVTGPAVSCIPISHFSETRVRDARTIDFLTTSRRGWRNVLPDSCPNLMTQQAFSYATSLSQLCSTDVIHPLVSSGGQLETTTACGLGQFTPIELKR